jgi:hypothetical protein
VLGRDSETQPSPAAVRCPTAQFRQFAILAVAWARGVLPNFCPGVCNLGATGWGEVLAPGGDFLVLHLASPMCGMSIFFPLIIQ